LNGLQGPAGPENPKEPSSEIWASQLPRVFKGDRTAQRVTLYFFVFLILFVGAFGLERSDWTSGTTLHGILETLSTLMAFVVGSLALVRFYSKKQGAFLFIGIGFLGTAILDTFSAVVAVVTVLAEVAGEAPGLFSGFSPAQLDDLSSWSFTASGAFLSVFLFLSWVVWQRDRKAPERRRIREQTVYLTALLLAVVTFGVFDLIPLTRTIAPDQFIRQPAELFPALFFLLAFLGFFVKSHWRYDASEHWLMVALLISVMVHGAFMPFSSQYHDALFVGAHLLKALSYVSVLVGLMASVYVTFRKEEEAADSTRETNAALAREIDFRRRAEREIQESEERLQDFLYNAHDLIQSVDKEGNFLYVNRAWMETLGYDEEAVKRLNLFDILDPSCRERCRADFAAVLEGADLPAVEVTFLAADGRRVLCSGSSNARLQEGEAVASRSIFRDITEEVEARNRLEAFQANLQALVENTGDAIWSVERSKRLITFNTAFSMALEARTDREPRIGDELNRCFPLSDVPWYDEMYGRALGGEAFSELRDEEIGGHVRSYEFFFNPIREAAGITGVAVFGKDVTARRRTQVALRMAKEEAERANRAKSQFLANMSHELRTPLNSVIGFTNILLKNRDENFGKQELTFLNRILANGKHLLELINEVLDLAKIEAGRMELELVFVHMRQLVQETLAQLEGQVKDKPLQLRGEVPEELDALHTDSGKLKQVIINLVGNALKFTEEGEVVVEVVAADDGRSPAAIVVRDTGIGIPPDRLQAIFDAFQQADGTTSRRFGGTGLGLTISRSLCKLLGYELRVESEVGKGSAFSIVLTEDSSLPERIQEELIEEALRPMESSRPASRAENATFGGKGRGGASPVVLVIDDDPNTRILLSHHLEDLGCDVVTAGSAGEGLKKAREIRPDLVTLDLIMPGMTGWEALKEFKADPGIQDIPVVIITVLPGGKDRGNLLGAVDLLTKPVEKEVLLRVLKRNLRDHWGRTVLVVEDDFGARTLIETHLRDAGLKVLVAENGEEAEAILEKVLPDLIVLDLVMPVMDGTAFLQRLRAHPERLGLPVIICTGKDLTEDDRRRLETQASGILPKEEGIQAGLKKLLGNLLPLNAPSRD
jgi:PAS domain S-box-containing protein